MPILKVGPISISPPPLWASCAMISGHSQSVPSSPVGPCCSLEPIGMTIVLERSSQASISAQVDRCSSMDGLSELRCTLRRLDTEFQLAPDDSRVLRGFDK